MKILKSFICILTMAILVLDSKTAANGIQEGIQLCLNSVIPSLFPFLVISKIIYSLNLRKISKVFYPVGRLCGMPLGSEIIFAIGLLGGYPMGAEMLSQAWKKGEMSKSDAQRMLGFCSNAGPAFIFGIGSTIFPIKSVFMLWLVHIISAIIVGFILPGKSKSLYKFQEDTNISLTDTIKQSIAAMSVICSWIILFRMIIKIIQHWTGSIITSSGFCILSGFLEITNGIFMLESAFALGIRYILFSIFISTGGICIAAQTMSIAKDLGPGLYFPGKLLQGCFSLLLTASYQPFIFEESEVIHLPIHQYIAIASIIFVTYLWVNREKTVAFLKKMMYNGRKFVHKGA